MKEALKRLAENTRSIEEIEAQMKNAKTLPYYDRFGTPAELGRDLQSCEQAIKDLLNEKHNILETLQLEINKELNLISQMQRENAPKTA